MKTSKVVGHGPRKVLLFPGLLGTREAFDEMLRYADLDNFQYAIAEYRGYGNARGEKGLLTLREIVIDTVRFVEFLGWDKFTVSGHSIGALVAQMVAVALPARVETIISIAGLSAQGASRDPDRVAFLQSLAGSRERREALVRTGTAGRYGDSVIRQIAGATWDAIDGAALASYALDASRTDIHTQVQALDIPVLVLVGEHDPNCSQALARETTLSWYPNARLEVLAGSGHYPIVEAPAATVSALEQFLFRVIDSSASEAKMQLTTPP